MLNIIIAVTAVTVIGFLAQRIGLCLVRGTHESIAGRHGLMLAILLSGVWLWIYAVLAELNAWPLPFERYGWHPMFMLGGFLFGLGAAFNHGCSVSTMSMLARGNLSMVFTMIGWLVGWCIWIAIQEPLVPLLHYPSINHIDLKTNIAIAVPSVLLTLFLIWRSPQDRGRWLAVICIGGLAGLLYYIEPLWAPSRLIQDSGHAALDGKGLPNGLRFTLLFMLLFGMWLSVFFRRDISLRVPGWQKILRHFSAGVLMGIGAGMALGGNDAQILMGLPAASIGGVTALASMIAGIACHYWLSRHIFATK